MLIITYFTDNLEIIVVISLIFLTNLNSSVYIIHISEYFIRINLLSLWMLKGGWSIMMNNDDKSRINAIQPAA